MNFQIHCIKVDNTMIYKFLQYEIATLPDSWPPLPLISLLFENMCGGRINGILRADVIEKNLKFWIIIKYPEWYDATTYEFLNILEWIRRRIAFYFYRKRRYKSHDFQNGLHHCNVHSNAWMDERHSRKQQQIAT